jgi:hypothetical protein
MSGPIYHWDIQQRTPEWDRLRLGRLTGSRVDDVMSDPRNKADKEAGRLSASATKMLYRCVSESFTGRAEFIRPTWEMDRGTKLEPDARTAFESATGLRLRLCGFVQHAAAGPMSWFGFSPDALIVGATEVIPVEVKCPTVDHARTVDLFVSGADPWDIVPSDYHSQLMAGQLCCHQDGNPAPYSFYVSFDPDWSRPQHKIVIVKVPASLDELADMRRRVERWCGILFDTISKLDPEETT